MREKELIGSYIYGLKKVKAEIYGVWGNFTEEDCYDFYDVVVNDKVLAKDLRSSPTYDDVSRILRREKIL